MKLVLLESPYAGDTERNVDYGRRCLRDSIMRGEAPMASHLLYTQPGVLMETLAIPQDTSALEAMITKAGEVMRQRAISAGSAINPIYGAGAAIDAIRALPNVTLEVIEK